MLLGINGMPHEVGVVPGLGFDGSAEELYYKFGEPIETDVILKKGENVITITIVDGYNLNIDCLEFTTTAKLYLALRDYDFEAEDADVGGLYSVIDSEKASGGRYVGDLERDGATVNFSIASDMTAYVMMRIYINHPFDTTFESRFLLTVNGSTVTVGEAKGTGYMNGAGQIYGIHVAVHSGDRTQRRRKRDRVHDRRGGEFRQDKFLHVAVAQCGEGGIKKTKRLTGRSGTSYERAHSRSWSA